MLRRFLTRQHQQSWPDRTVRRDSFSLQIVLWLLWSMMVAVVGYISWHADFVANRPINTLGLAIHCVVAGLVGLVALTMIEMYMEPWRFMDRDE